MMDSKENSEMFFNLKPLWYVAEPKKRRRKETDLEVDDMFKLYV